jgi:dihydroneopterin triphosphate diphosphatase
MQSMKADVSDGEESLRAPSQFKIPRSVLVVIHTPDLRVLLIERADSLGAASGVWQSVTGSLDFEGESWMDCAAREVLEETGLDTLASGHVLTDWRQENTYDIWPHYLHRYAPGVTRNTERVLGLCIPAPVQVQLSPSEHVNQMWLPAQEAALKVSSASNEAAIRRLFLS